MSRRIFCGRVGIEAAEVRWAWLDDHRLCFDLPVGPGERGVANIRPAPGSRVCGVLWAMGIADARRLDRTEGVHLGFYRRVHLEVVTGDGERTRAFAYRCERSVTGRKPSPRYLGLLLEGAREHGLPAEYVRYLESFELAIDERLAPERG